jgi:hypothetical protein
MLTDSPPLGERRGVSRKWSDQDAGLWQDECLLTCAKSIESDPDSRHIRGFYVRTAALYHHARGRSQSGCAGCHQRAGASGSTGRAWYGVPEAST